MNTSLYQIITEAQKAAGSKEKTAVLMKYQDNNLLKVYLHSVANPSISYYIANAPFVSKEGTVELDESILFSVVYTLAKRKLTGNTARVWLGELMESLTAEGQFLMGLLIDRKIGSGVGSSCILKVFPALWFEPSYQRCGLLTDKIRDSFDKEELFICEEKMDGSFIYLSTNEGNPQGFTRQGNFYPSFMTERLIEGIPVNNVVMGEMLVYIDGEMLSRKTGNGVINSVLDGQLEEREYSKYTFQVTAWDVITSDEFFIDKESKVSYKQRFDRLQKEIIPFSKHIELVPFWYVNDLKEAFVLYEQHLKEDKEGIIIKKLNNNFWKNNTSNDNIKLKLEFSIELELIEMHYGEKGSKYEKMLGSMTFASSDRLLISGCGTGITDKQRDMSMYSIGEIFTIKANDIISKEGTNILSLNLPVFIESRKRDKDEADDLPRIIAQLKAAKEGQPKII